MEKYIDLHTHSIYSEGILSCRELLQLARKYRIGVLSLTDHNVIDGVPEIMELGKKLKIKVIPGVELYTYYQNKGLHLLAYNFKLEDNELKHALQKLKKAHLQKVKTSLVNLKKAGFIIEEQRIFNHPSHYPGAVHIMKEIERHPANRKKMDRELPPKYHNYFGKVYYYLGKNASGYLKQSELPILKAIKLIKKAGGIAVLAHPGQQLTFEEDKIIHILIKGGLDGLEVLSPYHNWYQIEHYLKMAVKHRLLITGGSDFHGYVKIRGQNIINKQWDYYKIPYRLYRGWRKLINN
ncbi:MAG: hypothetical protein COT24_01585 [Candidatus Kerfeldbacteria bacterium CG08_land_8_20_14_0_20_40_16]|uniref:Polymerase/histidinol phosphatase N-terminal domain-containing protein n=1 Tax=Candidatus Kerfeldbacteria bacterium CG08_land_8_20_14_0_20_40_16 TaxID=2014244 RepID=A0A2H0YYJ7_9BACT|nr:MAG: hypothetical protein COT24_01585 [Candidatus Kerfeldbacteria bacterium CG08_land_8_20_14_0_20_40_16]